MSDSQTTKIYQKNAFVLEKHKNGILHAAQCRDATKYVENVNKLVKWSADKRAYYPQIRPTILHIAEISYIALKGILNYASQTKPLQASQFPNHPAAQAYVQFIRNILKFRDCFDNNSEKARIDTQLLPTVPFTVPFSPAANIIPGAPVDLLAPVVSSPSISAPLPTTQDTANIPTATSSSTPVSLPPERSSSQGERNYPMAPPPVPPPGSVSTSSIPSKRPASSDQPTTVQQGSASPILPPSASAPPSTASVSSGPPKKRRKIKLPESVYKVDQAQFAKQAQLVRLDSSHDSNSPSTPTISTPSKLQPESHLVVPATQSSDVAMLDVPPSRTTSQDVIMADALTTISHMPGGQVSSSAESVSRDVSLASSDDVPVLTSGSKASSSQNLLVTSATPPAQEKLYIRIPAKRHDSPPASMPIVKRPSIKVSPFLDNFLKLSTAPRQSPHFPPSTNLLSDICVRPSNGAASNVKFTLNSLQMEGIRKWRNAIESSNSEASSSLCVTVASYSRKTLDTRVDSDPEFASNLPRLELDCEWPQEREITLEATYNGEPACFPLSPPIKLTEDGLIDASSFVVEGANEWRMNWDVSNAPQCCFVFRIHPPTSGMLAELDALTQKRQARLARKHNFDIQFVPVQPPSSDVPVSA